MEARKRFFFAGRLQKKDIYGVGKLYFSCNSIVGLYFKRTCDF